MSIEGIRNRSQIRVITAGCFLSYFLFGMVDNMKGQTIPVLMEDAGYSYSAGGTIVFCEYAGFFAAAFLAGVIADLLGKKSTLVIAGVVLSVGAGGYALSSEFGMYAGFIFLIGLGLGMLELSGSNIISGVHTADRAGFYLNLLNAFYGVGAILTPLVIGIMLEAGYSWRTVYKGSLAVIVPALLYFILMKYPKDGDLQSVAQGRFGRSCVGEIVRLIRCRKVMIMCLFNFVYVAAEIAVATWFVEFLHTGRGMTDEKSAFWFSAYFTLIMLGRLAGSFFVDRIGRLSSLLIFTGTAVICLGTGVMGPEGAAWVLVLTGLGFSILFPTATAVIAEVPSANQGTMLGIFFACGGLGGMAGPWLAGIVSEAAGVKAGMMVNVFFCMVMMGLVLILRRSEKLPS